MKTARDFLDSLEQVTSPDEYLQIQSECIECVSIDDLLLVWDDPEINETRRHDCLQLMYWVLPRESREQFFREFMELNPEHPDVKAFEALVYRAIVESKVAADHPEAVPAYLESLKRTHAARLFAE